jgi:hypothetical protein
MVFKWAKLSGKGQTFVNRNFDRFGFLPPPARPGVFTWPGRRRQKTKPAELTQPLPGRREDLPR